MTHEAPRVAHVSPGRVRVKVPHAKHNPELATKLDERLSAIEGVKRAETNLLTGSIVLLFDAAEIAFEEIMPGVAEVLAAALPEVEEEAIAALLHPSANGAGAEPLAGQITGLLHSFDTRLGAASGGAVDLRVLLPMSLFFLGIGRLVASEQVVFPSWYDLLWFSFGTFAALNLAPVAPAK